MPPTNQANKLSPAKLSKKQTMLESNTKATTKKKAALKRKHREPNLNYEFIAKGDSYTPSLCCGIQLSNKDMKPSNATPHRERGIY